MSRTDDHTEVIDWLMEGDPAIRWQAMRDILDKPAAQLLFCAATSAHSLLQTARATLA